jgi:hypothetical protein
LKSGSLKVMPKRKRRVILWRSKSARLALLAERDFRTFYAGYATSLLGSAMSEIALTFAVLDSGGTAADLGYVFAAAAVLPQDGIGGGVCDPQQRRRARHAGDQIAGMARSGT